MFSRLSSQPNINDNIVVEYYYGNNLDEVLQMKRKDVDDVDGDDDRTELLTYQYHTDAQGNVVAVTLAGGNFWNGTGTTNEEKQASANQLAIGTIVEKYEYDVYGKVVIKDRNGTTQTHSLIDNPIMFQGQRYDEESGLYYMKNRYYDPEIGRFITRDPAQDGLNLYAFVNNNPINFVDPLGLRQALRLIVGQPDTPYLNEKQIPDEVMDKVVEVLDEYGFDMMWWRYQYSDIDIATKKPRKGPVVSSCARPVTTFFGLIQTGWTTERFYEMNIEDTWPAREFCDILHRQLVDRSGHEWNWEENILVMLTEDFRKNNGDKDRETPGLSINGLCLINHDMIAGKDVTTYAYIIIHEVLHQFLYSYDKGGHSAAGVMKADVQWDPVDSDGDGIDDRLQLDAVTARRLLDQCDLEKTEGLLKYTIGHQIPDTIWETLGKTLGEMLSELGGTLRATPLQ